MPSSPPPFWKEKSLAEMTPQEWESLCDGCARCCLHKLEDEEDGKVYYTRVACRLLDLWQCRCQNYAQRTEQVPDCLTLAPQSVAQLHWLPDTCAYRLLAQGRNLPSWHPLRSQEPDGVHRAGISVRGRARAEATVDPERMEEQIIRWVRS